MTTAAATVAESATSTPPDTPTEPFADAPTTATAEASTVVDHGSLTREELLEIENARLKRELASMVDDRHRAAELVDEADRADAEYEDAKARAKKAKEAREVAKSSLRALIHGDAQVQIDLSEKDDGKQAPGKVETPVSQRVEHRTVAGTYGAWQFGLEVKDLEDVENMALLAIEPELAKRKVRGIEILGGKQYLPLEAHYFADRSGYVNAWALIEPDEWNALHAEKYGEPVRDLDEEAKDVTAKRKAGGERCGITVKWGRKRFVVAPDDTAVRIVFTQVAGFPGVAEFEAKALIPDMFYKADVIAFPLAQLPDRLAKRLSEYVPTVSGFHEGLVSALASDLKVEPGEVSNAAVHDDRFDVRIEQAGDQAEEVVRLLMKPVGE